MRTRKIIIINGYPRSGKDTFIDICNELTDGKVARVSIIDPVKDIAAKCGWGGSKYARDRQFLCNLKNLLTEYNGYPMSWLNSEVCKFIPSTNNKDILFVTMREKADIEKFKKTWPRAETMLIIRIQARDEYMKLNDSEKNPADSYIYEVNYDHCIPNHGSLDDLKAEAKAFLEKLEVM